MWVSRATYDNLKQMNAQCATRLSLYEEMLKKLQADVERERTRADRAVDELLSLRGLPPVSPPPTMPTFQNDLDEDPERVADVESRMKQGDATVFTEGR